MEFSVKKHGGLLNALTAANDVANGDPKENIVILDMDCDGSRDDNQNSVTQHTFEHIRIEGAPGVKHTIKDFSFRCNGEIYLKDFNVTKDSITSYPDGFIEWNYTTDVVSNSSIYIDNVNVSRYRLFVYELAPQPNSGKSLSKIRMKNCTFKKCFGSMMRLYTRCDDAKVYGNTYIEPYVPDNIDTVVGENRQAAYVHNLVTLGSSSQNDSVYSRCPINNVEVFDNVMIGTYQKDGEDCIKNIYYYRLDNDGNKKKSETHLCCLHGDNIHVHDNLYRGWEMMNPTQEVGSEPIYIKGSNIKVIGNTIEDCTMGEGAITLKGARENVEIAHNRINPGYNVKQKTHYEHVEEKDGDVITAEYDKQVDSTHSLILLQSLGGVSLNADQKPSWVRAKIHSNHLVYKRVKTVNIHSDESETETYQDCKSAIYLNSSDTNKDYLNSTIDVDIRENYYEGMNDFIRCAQASKDVKMVVDNNTVITTGIIPSADSEQYKSCEECISALVSTGVNNFDNNLNLKICRNRGNVGVVFYNDYGSSQLYDEDCHTKVVISENDMSIRRVFLSPLELQHKNSAGVIVETANLEKNISIYVLSNKFSFRNEKDEGYTRAHSGGVLQSNNADVVIKENFFEFAENHLPHEAFAGSKLFILKLRSIVAINNVYKTKNKQKYSEGEFYSDGSGGYDKNKKDNSLIYCDCGNCFELGNVLIV